MTDLEDRLARAGAARLTSQEIQEVLADGGYTADQRKGWLKRILTQLEQEPAEARSPEHGRLIASIKDILGRYQNGRPKSDDVL